MTVPARGSTPSSSNATRRWLVATLLALFALQVLPTPRQTSPTSDEVALLPAGYLFLKAGLWHLLPEQPPAHPGALLLLALLALVIGVSWHGQLLIGFVCNDPCGIDNGRAVPRLRNIPRFFHDAHAVEPRSRNFPMDRMGAWVVLGL